jgi:hypothetical protein
MHTCHVCGSIYMYLSMLMRPESTDVTCNLLYAGCNTSPFQLESVFNSATLKGQLDPAGLACAFEVRLLIGWDAVVTDVQLH